MQSLIEAIQSGGAFTVEQHLAAGSSPNTVDEKTGESILAIAAGRGDLPLVELLLDRGADPNFPETIMWPIELAAGRGFTEIVELLLDYDAEPDVQDEDGCTPLIAAAAGGRVEIVELLLEAGADARHKDRCGKRPILFAAEKGHQAIVECLGPLSTAKDRHQAALMIRLSQQGPPSEVVREFFTAAQKGDMNAVRAYLDAGGDVDAMDDSGETALLWAARRNQPEVVKLLVDRGADVNHLSGLGDFPLNSASMRLDSRVYDFLYELTSKQLRATAHRRAERAKRIAIENGFGELVKPMEQQLEN